MSPSTGIDVDFVIYHPMLGFLVDAGGGGGNWTTDRDAAGVHKSYDIARVALAAAVDNGMERQTSNECFVLPWWTPARTRG